MLQIKWILNHAHLIQQRIEIGPCRNSSLLRPAWIKAWRQPSSRLWTTSAVRAWPKHLVPRQDLNQAMSIHRSIHDPSTHSIHLFSQASIHPWIRHHPASSITIQYHSASFGIIHIWKDALVEWHPKPVSMKNKPQLGLLQHASMLNLCSKNHLWIIFPFKHHLLMCPITVFDYQSCGQLWGSSVSNRRILEIHIWLVVEPYHWLVIYY